MVAVRDQGVPFVLYTLKIKFLAWVNSLTMTKKDEKSGLILKSY